MRASQTETRTGPVMPDDHGAGAVAGPPSHLRTLVSIGRWRAAQTPEQLAFTFLADGEHESANFTYAELDRRARAIAVALQQRGAAGQRVLLLFHPGLDFVAALCGCLYAGAIAVPVTPPEPLRLARTLPRLRAIVSDAAAQHLLGSGDLLEYVAGSFSETRAATLLASEDIPAAAADAWQPIAEHAQALALLQYTSGSTESPRGIVLTHANLMHSFAGMFREDVDQAVGVIWLPPYHDFGLIAGLMLPLYAGRRVVLMSPLSFVERPVRWLQAISRYRGTTTGSPNFGYELCVRKVRPDDCRGLDLSSWRIAAVGAEMVRAETLDAFTQAFAPYGFRRETFLPAYGLAEAVLNVTSGRWHEAPVVRCFSRHALLARRAEGCGPTDPGAWRLVGCGRPWHGQRVAVVDPQTRTELPPGQVGELWVQSPNVGQGYWNRPAETDEVFRARLNGDNGYCLRTGDLGFYDQGELFVVGRLKELIILNGRNYYPADVEQVVGRAHPALRPNEGAAVACDVQGTERLVIIQEVRRSNKYPLEEVLAAIRRELIAEFLLLPYAIVLIPGGSLPRTNSGKTCRRACAALFAEGGFEVLAQWQAHRNGQSNPVLPRSPLEERLAAVWAAVLHLPRVGVEDNFFELGGNSLLATELYVRLQPLIPPGLSLARLFEHPTVAGLAELIVAGQLAAETDPALASLLTRIEALSDDEANRLRHGAITK